MKPLTHLINCAPEGAAAEWHQSSEEFKDSEDVIAVIAYSEYQAQEKRIFDLEQEKYVRDLVVTSLNQVVDAQVDSLEHHLHTTALNRKFIKENELLRKQVEILQRPLDDQIISRIVCLVKNIPDEELASNVFESVRNMTNWNKSTPAEFLVLFDKTAAPNNGE